MRTCDTVSTLNPKSRLKFCGRHMYKHASVDYPPSPFLRKMDLRAASDPEIPLDLKSPAIDASLTTRPPCAQSHTADGTRVKPSASTARGHGTLQHTGPLVLKCHVPPQCLEARMHNELLWLARAHMPWSSPPPRW